MAMKLERQRRRKRRVVTVVTTLALGLLVFVGNLAGQAVGWAAGAMHDGVKIPFLLSTGASQLAAHKVMPPQPIDMSGPAQACPASSLNVSILVDQAALDPGQGVGVHVTVRNTGRYPCLVNGGMENMRVRIVDDAGNVAWNAEHCGFGGTRKLLMGPGNHFTWDFGWDGHASAPEVCTGWQPELHSGAWQIIAGLAEVAHSDSEPTTILVRGAVPPPPPPPVDVVPEPIVEEPAPVQSTPVDSAPAEPEQEAPIEEQPPPVG